MPTLHALVPRGWRRDRATTIRPSVTVAALTSLATERRSGPARASSAATLSASGDSASSRRCRSSCAGSASRPRSSRRQLGGAARWLAEPCSGSGVSTDWCRRPGPGHWSWRPGSPTGGEPAGASWSWPTQRRRPRRARLGLDEPGLPAGGRDHRPGADTPGHRSRRSRKRSSLSPRTTAAAACCRRITTIPTRSTSGSRLDARAGGYAGLVTTTEPVRSPRHPSDGAERLRRGRAGGVRGPGIARSIHDGAGMGMT